MFQKPAHAFEMKITNMILIEIFCIFPTIPIFIISDLFGRVPGILHYLEGGQE